VSSMRRMRSMGPANLELAVGPAGQLPAALMDRPMMGPAHQGQIRQIGGAAVQPVDQMMGLTPGQGPLAVGEHTAAVAHGQGAALGRGDDPAGPAQVQGWLGAPPRTGGNRAATAWSRSAKPPSPPQSSWERWPPGSWPWWPPGWWPLASWPWASSSFGWWPVGWRVTRIRVRAPSQASRRHASGPRATVPGDYMGPTPPTHRARRLLGTRTAHLVPGR
jgi:hypothetical protein